MNERLSITPASDTPASVAPVTTSATSALPGGVAATTAYPVLFAMSLAHFINDMMQSLLPSVYPILKANYHLDFAQIGLITFVSQLTASLLQPLVGLATDRRPLAFSLAIGMCFTCSGILLLANANIYGLILLAAALGGTGSSVFHPESSRVVRMASGGRFGFAQSVFQVGGNFGTATGPLLAALIVLPFGQKSIAWFALLAGLGIVLLYRIGLWYRPRIVPRAKRAMQNASDALSRRQVTIGLSVLVLLIFSKNFYLASLSSYYTFFLIHKFGVSTQAAQLYLFVFLGSVALGTILGGPIGDFFGRRYVIWFSILGVLPFTLALPYADLMWTGVLSVCIGFILASAFPAIVVYGQEMMPNNVGAVAGLFFGLAFGFSAIGAALLGIVADHMGIEFVYRICALLPAIGILAIFLPRVASERRARV